jgi:hypothetical protein
VEGCLTGTADLALPCPDCNALPCPDCNAQNEENLAARSISCVHGDMGVLIRDDDGLVYLIVLHAGESMFGEGNAFNYYAHQVPVGPLHAPPHALFRPHHTENLNPNPKPAAQAPSPKP